MIIYSSVSLSHSFRRQLHSRSPLLSHSLDLPLQEAHLTPAAPREGQRPDLTNRSQNQVLLGDQGLNPLPGEDQGLAVLDTAVATDISPGHTLPDPGDTGICTAGLNI